jgi:methyl-accepting chemotaxis protein
MKRIADLSIRSKLTFIVMTTTCGALGLAMTAMGVFDTFSVRAQLRRDAVTNARIIANNSTAAFSFGDEHSASETLDALAVDGRLGAAGLYNAEGEQIALYRRPHWKNSPPPTLIGNYVTFSPEQIEVAEPVLLNGQRLGTVLVQVDLQDLRKRQWQGIATAAAVLLGAVGLSYLLTSRWQRLIATPIQDLAEASIAVAGEKNYAVRVTKQANDELGQLVDGFNNMLSQIEIRDKALREAHADLEHRVAERTRDLFQTKRDR